MSSRLWRGGLWRSGLWRSGLWRSGLWRSGVLLGGLLLSMTCCQKAVKPASQQVAKKAPVAATSAGNSNKAADPTGLVAQGRLFQVRLVFSPVHPKVSELFSVRTTVTKLNGEPVKIDTFSLDATMPSHGHGMMTRPQHTRAADGSWGTEGMKLHMHGKWVFEIQLGAGKQRETLTLPFEQPPEAR